MYPIEIFLAILVIDGLLCVYAVVDNGAKYYKNIIAWGLACFLSIYLAIVSVAGTVSIQTMQIKNMTVQNLTANSSAVVNTVYTYNPPVVMQDDGLMWIFYILAGIQGFLILLAILEAYEEHLNGKDKENLIQ